VSVISHTIPEYHATTRLLLWVVLLLWVLFFIFPSLLVLSVFISLTSLIVVGYL
jgi:hypothetical protein